MSERSSGGPYLLLAAAAFNIGLAAGHFTSKNSNNDEDKVHDVQIYNHQIQTELDQSFDTVDDLTLTIDGKKLAFVGDGENCSGKYAVTERVAHVAGEVACSVELESTTTTG